MSKVIDLTDENFDENTKGDKPVLVKFGASWCPPCRVMVPVLEQLAKELSETVTICDVDVDDSPDLAKRFGVKSIPHIIVLKDGKVESSNVGSCTKEKLLSLLK
jgi:thioredoxin 1